VSQEPCGWPSSTQRAMHDANVHKHTFALMVLPMPLRVTTAANPRESTSVEQGR
jgi:hypothetical protein